MESHTPLPISSNKPSKEHSLQLGNVVRMSCGGPKMTVTNLLPVGTGEPTVYCRWFDAKGRIQGDRFEERFLNTTRAEF